MAAQECIVRSGKPSAHYLIRQVQDPRRQAGDACGNGDGYRGTSSASEQRADGQLSERYPRLRSRYVLMKRAACQDCFIKVTEVTDRCQSLWIPLASSDEILRLHALSVVEDSLSGYVRRCSRRSRHRLDPHHRTAPPPQGHRHDDATRAGSSAPAGFRSSRSDARGRSPLR